MVYLLVYTLLGVLWNYLLDSREPIGYKLWIYIKAKQPICCFVFGNIVQF